MLQQLEPVVSRLVNLQHTMGILRGFAAPSNQHAAVLAVGVGVALLAGAVGVYYIQGQTSWSRKRTPKSLTAEDWKAAFDPDGRLINGGARIIGKVRRGGVAPEIRSEVWPFLLGVHELDSTEGERKKKKLERRRKYLRLRKQVEALSQRIQEVNAPGGQLPASTAGGEKHSERVDGRGGLEDERTRESLSGKETSTGNKEGVPNEGGSGSDQEEVADEQGNGTVNETNVEGQPLSQKKSANGGSIPLEEMDSASSSNTASAEVDLAHTSSDDRSTESPPNLSGVSSSVKEDAKALEDFQTWLRIIRLDAVRMNAAWIPYAPTQAACAPETAETMAKSVGLENDEHLEPARRAHAARLVAILEAYAVYDKETGYCQGMSDLLSPFVALIESDSEAFWCFQRFMRSAKHNFRLDEKGIRGQLNRIAAILEQGDPEFYRHLVAIGAGDCIFAYRMVVVLFRRELSFEQTLSLWEVCWADALVAEQTESVVNAAGAVGGIVEPNSGQKVPTKDLLLYAIAAAVRQKRRQILGECTAMDEVLKECNAMANNIDLWRTLHDARVLVQLCPKDCK